MKKLLALGLFLSLVGSATADVVIYSSSKVPLTFQAEGQTGPVGPRARATPAKTVIKNKQGEKTPFKITTADGTVVYSGEGAYSRTFFVSDTAEGLKCQKVGWFAYNGQKRPQFFRLLNITTEPLSFVSKDAAGPKPKMTVQPGEFVDVPTEYAGNNVNPLELQFEGDFTTKVKPQMGQVTVLYTVPYAAKSILGQDLAPVAMPKGYSE